jgi:hypothetical protein
MKDNKVCLDLERGTLDFEKMLLGCILKMFQVYQFILISKLSCQLKVKKDVL